MRTVAAVTYRTKEEFDANHDVGGTMKRELAEKIVDLLIDDGHIVFEFVPIDDWKGAQDRIVTLRALLRIL